MLERFYGPNIPLTIVGCEHNSTKSMRAQRLDRRLERHSQTPTLHVGTEAVMAKNHAGKKSCWEEIMLGL